MSHLERATTSITLDVSVNGQPHRLAAGTTLAELLDSLAQAAASIATAVNGEFVARDRRAARLLHEGDQVTCFQAIVGG